ncbi:MAG: hypothetical protein AB7U05_00235 [Mangrovibacterium sp.]
MKVFIDILALDAYPLSGSKPLNGYSHDLTFTTNEMVELDELVTFEGTVAVDKDFGAGYFYELIVEGASLKQTPLPIR